MKAASVGFASALDASSATRARAAFARALTAAAVQPAGGRRGGGGLWPGPGGRRTRARRDEEAREDSVRHGLPIALASARAHGPPARRDRTRRVRAVEAGPIGPSLRSRRRDWLSPMWRDARQAHRCGGRPARRRRHLGRREEPSCLGTTLRKAGSLRLRSARLTSRSPCASLAPQPTAASPRTAWCPRSAPTRVRRCSTAGLRRARPRRADSRLRARAHRSAEHPGRRPRREPPESLGVGAMKALRFIPGLRRYRPIEARTVAKALLAGWADTTPGTRILRGRRALHAGRLNEMDCGIAIRN